MKELEFRKALDEAAADFAAKKIDASEAFKQSSFWPLIVQACKDSFRAGFKEGFRYQSGDK